MTVSKNHHQGLLLKCKFWFSRTRMRPKILPCHCSWSAEYSLTGKVWEFFSKSTNSIHIRWGAQHPKLRSIFYYGHFKCWIATWSHFLKTSFQLPSLRVGTQIPNLFITDLFYWSIVDVQSYLPYRYTIKWFIILKGYTPFIVIIKYWLYSLYCTVYSCSLFYFFNLFIFYFILEYGWFTMLY